MDNRELADLLEELSKKAELPQWRPGSAKGAAESFLDAESSLLSELRANLPAIIAALRG